MATAAPTIDWLSDPLDFAPTKAAPFSTTAAATKSVTRPQDSTVALLLQRAKVPERSSTVYTVYPRTPDAVAEAAARPKKKAPDVRARIAKKMRAGAPKISKRWHPEGFAHAMQLCVESKRRLVAGRVEP
jgi:hypothetical protein